jgi:hypothetical protein
MDVSGQLHTYGRFSPQKEPRSPLNRRLGNAGWDPILDVVKKSLLPLPEFETRTFQPAAQSLY